MNMLMGAVHSPGAHTDAYTTYAETLVVRLSVIGVPAIVWWAVVALCVSVEMFSA